VPTQEESFAPFAQLFPEGDLVAAMRDESRVAAFRDALAAIVAPDVEVVMVGPGGFSATFRGIDGFVEGWRDWLEPFTSYRMELDPEVRSSGDAVVLFARQVATPRGSGATVTNDAASVAFLREGKIRRIEFHLDRAAALRAAELGG
jgi:ketosteroid isomerase-like protein